MSSEQESVKINRKKSKDKRRIPDNTLADTSKSKRRGVYQKHANIEFVRERKYTNPLWVSTLCWIAWTIVLLLVCF